MPSSKSWPSEAHRLYAALWQITLPFLRTNNRLKSGWPQRIFEHRPRPPLDLWIQAASAGEAYLAQMVVDNLIASRCLRIWLTTNTVQGLQILQSPAHGMSANKQPHIVQTGYFPFDHPGIVRKVLNHCRPRVIVLLESELWPSLMKQLRQSKTHLLIANGRMSETSFRHYRLWPRFWREIAPDQVLAISDTDAERFKRVFKPAQMSVINNIKFDRLKINKTPSGNDSSNILGRLLPQNHPFVVLGSVRKPEEAAVLKIVQSLAKLSQKPVVGLFPRHMERIGPWIRQLKGSKLNWALRSRLKTVAQPGSVILWDTFGELSAAYQLASGAFVGGSLKPLGGQNFLEPLANGIVPVIGPFWKNFVWVGDSIVSQGLVHQAPNWQGVLAGLQQALQSPSDPLVVKKAARQYLDSRRGGSLQVCKAIQSHLQSRT